MSRRIADLFIKIGADSYEFRQKAQQVEKGLGSLEKKLTSVGKSLSLRLTAPLAALGGVSLHLADVQAKAEAKVQQALKTTNQTVGYNFRQLTDYASELQGKTIFGDETILAKSTARLLAFTNITGENFKRTQALALDLATALEMDLGSASLQLGKALSDPLTKLSSLSRAGITFSEEQTAVIRQLAKTGELAKAQAMILDELEKKFGGQAEAAARTGLGAVQQLKNAWGDFLEQIGAAIMPFATKVAGALSTVVQMLQSMSPAMMQTIVVVAGLVAAVGPLSLGIGAVIKVLPMLAAGFTALLSPVGLIMAAILALGAAFAYARIQKQKMIDVMAETESLDDLERRLQENIAEQKEIIATTTKTRIVPNGLMAGFTIQKTADQSKLAPLRKEYDLLTAAIEKKREAEKKAAEAQAEMDKVTEEARKQTEELMKSIAGTNAQTEQSTGIIGKLQARIEALEKKKLLPESTVEDIAAANAEIEKLQKELERIRNIKPEDLNPVVKMDGILPEGFELELPAPKLKMGDLKPVTSQYVQQMQAIFGAVREGLYGWADDNSAYLQEHIADTVSMVENYTAALTAKGWSFSAALEHVQMTVTAVMQRFDQQVSQFMADSIVAVAEAIGQIIAGDLGFGGLMKAILTQFASFLKNIGSQLIEFGVMIIAFKSALKSVLANPWAAIAIGAAMVAAPAVMTALINKNAEKSVPALANGGLAYGPTYAMVGDNPNAGTDPEVIAPLSKLQAMLPTSGATQNLRITLGGQLTAKGRDLVYVLGKENFKTEILGG
nr:MAG TPA: tail tape measure [Caudoviricetes sp.]